jgi:hypothetical protein
VEILKGLGCATQAEFFERISDHGSKSPWETGEDEGLIFAEDFTFEAFPEFPPQTVERINNSRDRQGSTFDDLRGYIAAYELTYRHHYEMQDDWFAIHTDGVYENITGISPEHMRAKFGDGWSQTPMGFGLFEYAMLCIADDDYWLAKWRDVSGAGHDDVFFHWIIEWRIKLGKHTADIDGPWRAAIWRDNWRDVRDAVAAINGKDYTFPTRPRLPRGDRLEPFIVLAERLMAERGITQPDDVLRSCDDPAFETAVRIAQDILRLAKGPWRAYIEARSGEPFHLASSM